MRNIRCSLFEQKTKKNAYGHSYIIYINTSLYKQKNPCNPQNLKISEFLCQNGFLKMFFSRQVCCVPIIYILPTHLKFDLRSN